MKRFATVLALALAVAMPTAAFAKHKASPAPGASGAPASLAGLSQTVPACPASDPAVWVNTTSKIYWAQGTQYYGKTKHGGYACTSAAAAMGARAAKPSPIGHGSSMKTHKGGAMPLPSPSP